MEIVKQNETYKITDTVDSWVMEGTASKDVSGAININFSVTVSGELSEYLGDCGYFKPADTSMVSTNFNVAEPNRNKFVAYIDTVIDSILEHFSTEE